MYVFSPEALAQKPQIGRRVPLTWTRLVQFVTQPITLDDKASAGGFVLAELRDGVRRNDHVVSVSAFGGDHDSGTVSAAAAHRALARVLHAIYTTHSHKTEAPRWRAVLPFDRAPTYTEFRTIVPIVRGQFESAGIELDPSAKDACRLWYVPAIKPGAPFESYVGDGPMLVVDDLLQLARAAEAERATERARRPPPPEPGETHHDVYVRAAIDNAARSIQNGREGERHYLVCREAFSLARFGLSEAQIAAALIPSAVHAMGEGRRAEIERTIRDAVRARGAA